MQCHISKKWEKAVQIVRPSENGSSYVVEGVPSGKQYIRGRRLLKPHPNPHFFEDGKSTEELVNREPQKRKEALRTQSPRAAKQKGRIPIPISPKEFNMCGPQHPPDCHITVSDRHINSSPMTNTQSSGFHVIKINGNGGLTIIYWIVGLVILFVIAGGGIRVWYNGSKRSGRRSSDSRNTSKWRRMMMAGGKS